MLEMSWSAEMKKAKVIPEQRVTMGFFKYLDHSKRIRYQFLKCIRVNWATSHCQSKTAKYKQT